MEARPPLLLLLLLQLQLLLLHLGVDGEAGAKKCAGLPDRLSFGSRKVAHDSTGAGRSLENLRGDFWRYHPHNASLSLDLTAILHFDDDQCLPPEKSPDASEPDDHDDEGRGTADNKAPLVTWFKVDLIQVEDLDRTTASVRPLFEGGGPAHVGRRCRILPEGASVQASAVVNSSHPFATFNYVQGAYYLRLSLCRNRGRICLANLRHVMCSGIDTFEADTPKNPDVCHFKAPANLEVDVSTEEDLDPAVNQEHLGDVHPAEQNCRLTIRATVPVCTAHQEYDHMSVAVVPQQQGQVPEDSSSGHFRGQEVCAFDDPGYLDSPVYDQLLDSSAPLGAEETTIPRSGGDSKFEVSVVRLKPCQPGAAGHLATQCSSSAGLGATPGAAPGTREHAFLEHSVEGLERNTSYCLFFRLNNPHCRGLFGCMFYTRPLKCTDLLRERSILEDPLDSHHSSSVGDETEVRHFQGLKGLVTEPVFIGVVSLTLFLSLSLLMWTVVQCSKGKSGGSIIIKGDEDDDDDDEDEDAHDGHDEYGERHVDHGGRRRRLGRSMGSSKGLKRVPPRSLTEDDLEHISRLPSQEIVLVYFPDTRRFKDLNRKLRDWLVTLDVNDVKDIYDEKCSEEVLKCPEQWVRRTLGGPEKRIILVCSRLAYECLSSVKRRSASYMKAPLSPRFVDTDPHFGLLTRAIGYVEREMKGNYRNLICVRYEDIKICDRAYSSEAFNIVPGTEYVLPQHLEDIYRWIHPRNPRPECWSETRPEVKALLDAMREYRHHDDNIFTVQFASETLVADITPIEEQCTKYGDSKDKETPPADSSKKSMKETV